MLSDSPRQAPAANLKNAYWYELRAAAEDGDAPSVFLPRTEGGDWRKQLPEWPDPL